MGANRNPYAKGTFRAIAWASKEGIWVVCTPCRRYRPLYMTTDIAERLWTETWFRCRHCGGRSQASGRDPSTAPECQGFELDIGAIEGALRRPEPPPPVWMSGTHPGLQAVKDKGLLILAELDWRPLVLMVWLGGAWTACHDKRPVAGEVTSWRLWEGDNGACRALGL